MEMCTGCGRLDSEPIGKEHLACCPDSDYKEVTKCFEGPITLDKDKIKELEKKIEGLESDFVWCYDNLDPYYRNMFQDDKKLLDTLASSI